MFSQDDFDSSLCPICMEKYAKSITIPLLLACGHTLCLNCLRIARSKRETYGHVQCPVCRLDIVHPNPPINFQLMDLFLEALQVRTKLLGVLKSAVKGAFTREVHYSGMPVHYGSEKIVEIFAIAGEIAGSAKGPIIAWCAGEGTVTFKSAATARNAVELLHGTSFPLSNRTLVLDMKRMTEPHTLDVATYCKWSNCPLCFEPYSESTNRKPLSFEFCGHTVCNYCFDKARRVWQSCGYVNCLACYCQILNMNPPVNFSLMSLKQEVDTMREDLIKQIKEAEEKSIAAAEVPEPPTPPADPAESRKVDFVFGMPPSVPGAPDPGAVYFYGFPEHFEQDDVAAFFSLAGEIGRDEQGKPLIQIIPTNDAVISGFVIFKNAELAKNAEEIFDGSAIQSTGRELIVKSRAVRKESPDCAPASTPTSASGSIPTSQVPSSDQANDLTSQEKGGAEAFPLPVGPEPETANGISTRSLSITSGYSSRSQVPNMEQVDNIQEDNDDVEPQAEEDSDARQAEEDSDAPQSEKKPDAHHVDNDSDAPQAEKDPNERQAEEALDAPQLDDNSDAYHEVEDSDALQLDDDSTVVHHNRNISSTVSSSLDEPNADLSLTTQLSSLVYSFVNLFFPS